MIIKDKTDLTIEKLKAKANLHGDCYLINGHLLESLESHNRTFQRNCLTIEEAEQDRLQIIEEEKARLAELALLEEELHPHEA